MGQALIARYVAVFATAIICLCVAPASVGATVRGQRMDVTDAYLHALYALVHGEWSHVGASVGAIKDEVGSIDRECPSSLTDVPEGKQLIEISVEIKAAIRFSLYKPYAKMIMRFETEIKGFRPGDRTLTRLIRLAIPLARAVSTLAIPDVCADIAAWTAGDYHMLPQDTIRFVDKVKAISQDTTVVHGGMRELLTARILEVIKLHESSSEKQRIARVNRLEAATEGRLTRVYGMAISEVASILY
jgi:hypothetical protein